MEMSQNVTSFVAGIIRNGWILWTKHGNERETRGNIFLFVIKLDYV